MIYAFVFSFFLATSSQAASHHPEEFLNSIKGNSHEGEEIYTHFCSTCHAEKPVIPIGAPRIKNKVDWAPRVKGGLKQLIKNTNEGLRAMPPRGGCFECSDEQLLSALIYLLPDNSLKDLKVHKKSK